MESMMVPTGLINRAFPLKDAPSHHLIALAYSLSHTHRRCFLLLCTYCFLLLHEVCVDCRLRAQRDEAAGAVSSERLASIACLSAWSVLATQNAELRSAAAVGLQFHAAVAAVSAVVLLSTLRCMLCCNCLRSSISNLLSLLCKKPSRRHALSSIDYRSAKLVVCLRFADCLLVVSCPIRLHL